MRSFTKIGLSSEIFIKTETKDTKEMKKIRLSSEGHQWYNQTLECYPNLKYA